MTNKIESLYHELLEVVEKDGAACVVSKYHDDGSVIKELVSADDKDAWERLLELEKQPGVVVKGPVSSINALGAIGDAAVTAAPAASPAALTVVEHYTSKPRMIILGAGHIAAQLAPIAKQAEFDILLYDDRASFANRANFPDANEIICDGFSNLFSRVKLRNSDYVVIVTRGHKHDADCLRGILSGVEPAYTGMIGSKRRVAIVMDMLKEEGYSEERIGRIHSPIGLKIGAITPFEIAISIISEIISVKRLGLGAGELACCDLDIVRELAEAAGEYDALVTICDSYGSVPIDCGAKLAMSYVGKLAGTVGGGCSEAEAMQVARELIQAGGGWRTHDIDMTDSAEEDGMVCGGMMRVVIETIPK